MPFKIKSSEENIYVFNDSAGARPVKPNTTYHDFNVKNLPDGSGWIGQTITPGNPRASQYMWRAKTCVAGVGTVGGEVELYLASISNSYWDGNLANPNVVLVELNKKKNLQYLGVVQIDSSTSGTPLITGGYVEIKTASVKPVWFNHTGIPLGSGIDDHVFFLTGIPDEIQS